MNKLASDADKHSKQIKKYAAAAEQLVSWRNMIVLNKTATSLLIILLASISADIQETIFRLQ